jgi:predicted nucleic acid-binding protein
LKTYSSNRSSRIFKTGFFRSIRTRREAAALAAQQQRDGRPADLRDTQIAGIALARRATLATRNVRHFQGLDVEVIDPWKG